MAVTANGNEVVSETRQSNGTTKYSSSTFSSSRQLNVQKATILREVTSKVSASSKRDLSSAGTATIENTTEAGVVLDYIAAERLRCMPHSGSRYDKVLRWAEIFIINVSAFTENVNDVVMYNNEAAQLIWGSTLLLLQLGEAHVDLLDKIFSIVYKLSLSLDIFTQHSDLLLESSAAQKSCGNAYAALVQVISQSSFHYSKKATSGVVQIKAGEFERLFGKWVQSFYSARSTASTQMWTASLQASSISAQYDIETVRRFLAAQDSVTEALLSGRISSRHTRAQFTCEWAAKRLSDFARSNDHMTIITGKEYSGKSVLAGWIAERMKNTKGRIAHDVISFDVDPALKDHMSPLAVIQGLVLQTFDKLVGDVTLYQNICSAINATSDGKNATQIADLLWVAFDGAVSKLGKIMIIVDGLDQFEENQKYDFLGRLQQVSSKNQGVKVIAVCRPLAKVPPKDTKLWSIEPENTKVDIGYFAFERLSAMPALKSLPEDQIQGLVERITSTANGSFAWADIAIQIVASEKTLAGIKKTLDSLPKNLKELINKLVTTVSLNDKETRLIFAWMLAAQRPLLLDEIKHLLEVDCTSVSINERFTDVQDDLRRACGRLVNLTDGVVRFQSLAIRHHLIELAASVKDFSNSAHNAFPFNIQEASYDLCLRLLAYSKLSLDRQYQISVAPLTATQLIDTFDDTPLLEYASRFWLVHFRNSPMHQYPGAHKLTGTFKAVFPSSVSFALIEGTCIPAQYTLQQAHDFLQLALTLRRTVLGETSEAVLQTLISTATVRQRLVSKETNTLFYQAFKLAYTITGNDSEISITCAERYISSVTTLTRSTEIEEVLTYIVDIQRKISGVSHDITIKYMQRLAEYYVTVKDETKASTIYRELYEVMTSRYGYSDSRTETVFKSLKSVSKSEDIKSITQQQQTVAERKSSIVESTNVTSRKDLIQQYESEKNTEKVEELMVNHWRELSEKSRTSKDVKVQEQQVDATFEYVNFLQRQNRKEEATTILNGLYLELEKSTSFNQSKISWIERIGEQMKSMGSATSATNVFTYLWGYYRSTGKQNTQEAQKIVRSLTETVTSTVSTTTSIETQVETLKEILETTSMSSETIDITTVKTTQHLIAVYSRQEKHEEIIEISRTFLQRHWAAVLTGQKDVTLPSQFVTQSIDIATQLVQSYMKLHYVEEASQILYSIFQAYRSQPKQYTKEFTSLGHQLISHYQSIHRYSDTLYVYQALYDTLVQVYGATSEQCITVLYEKADLELQQNRRKAAQASYEKICASLKGSSDLCHRDAVRAALALSKIYEKEQSWDSARSIYSSLWQTFLKKGQEYNLGVEFVDQVFDRYIFIIENKTRSDYKTLRGLAAEYRETCTKYYGGESERTLTASMKLAALDEKDEQHKDEAITIYESILSAFSTKKIATASKFTVAATARRRLAHLYSERHVTSDKAKTLYEEEFESEKNKHGSSSADTLFWLRLLVSCYKKRNTAEANKTASSLLEETSVDVILHETDTTKMYEASKTVASIFKDQNVTHPSASEFVTMLRQHVVSGDGPLTGLKGKTITRRSYNFIVGLEEAISGSQFTVIMSQLMTESLLTEAFMKAKKTNASFDTCFSYGIRLRSFLKSNHRQEFSRIEDELLQLMTTRIVGKREIDPAAVKQFLTIVIAEHEKDAQDLIVLQRVFDALSRALNENQFARGYALALLVDLYLHQYDGFRSQTKIEIAFKICLFLSGRGTRKCNDAKLEQQMSHLSGVLLEEVLQAAKSIRLNLVALPLEELNSLVGLLGQQKNYDDLEWILHDLWTARHSQSSWPATTVVAIGRRLVECRFSMGHRAEALELLEDICYNLRRVWGPLDKTTLEIEMLRAQMYTSVGQFTKVMGVHEDILAHLTSDEIDMDQVNSAEEATIAARHLAELRVAFFRNGGKWPAEKDEQHYDELYHVVKNQVGKEKAWQDAKVDDVNKWSSAARSYKDDGSRGWSGVTSGHWEFMADNKVKHVNTLRHRARLSGNWVNGSNGEFVQVNGSNGTNGSSVRTRTETRVVYT